MRSSSKVAPASTTSKAGSASTSADRVMVELLLVTPEAQVESVSDALMDELDALSVSVEDADAGTDAEHALFGEPGMPAPQGGWQRSVVKALFTSEDAAREAAELLLAQDW